MKKRIFVLVDFQNDFVQPDGALSINNPDLIERVQTFNNNLQKGMFERIIVTADTHFEETYLQTPEADNFPLHCVYKTWGWNQAVSFKDNIPVDTLYKSTTNIWNEVNGYKFLQEDMKGTEVYIAGVLSDICVQQAMEGFLKRGAKVVLLDDLTQGLEKQTTDIIQEPKYAQAVEKGVLSNITSTQFFRIMLLEKKQQINRINTGREF